MNPQANVAASKSLPLGTTAKVINLQNGKLRRLGWKIAVHSSQGA